MKIAAFQLDAGDGTVHLLCVPIRSFKAACELESWLNTHVEPQCSVKFFGRYDRVQTLTGPEEVKSALMTNSNAHPRAAVVSIEAGIKRLLSSQ